MSELKTRTINSIIRVEGGFVDDPDDSGGATNYGITEQVARDYGYQGSMKDLPKTLATQIYGEIYWDALSLSTIEILSPSIAEEIADTSVNQGVDRAASFLQRSLNVLNSKGKLYPDIAVDHDVGPATLRALSDYLAYRGNKGETVLLRMLNSLQGAFYVKLSERREKDETFIFGWFDHRVKI